MLDVLQLGVDGFGRIGQKKIVRPPGGFDEDFLSVDFESFVAGLVRVSFDLPNSESYLGNITNFPVGYEAQIQIVQIRFAQILRPPELRIFNIHIREFNRFPTLRFEMDRFIES